MQQIWTIPARYNGPPKSANGGYACGLMGRALAAGRMGCSVEAALMMPPPLDTDLTLACTDSTADLTVAGQLVGRAALKPLDLPVPALPSPLTLGMDPVKAPGVTGKFKPFDTCYVCGSARRPGDGLCIYCRCVEGHPGMVAAPWALGPEHAGAGGLVDPVYIWAALDCPGYFACVPGEAALLGRLTVEMIAPLKAEGTVTVLGWDLTGEGGGRKRRCGTAVYDTAGTLIAKAEGLWIIVDPAKIPA